MPSDEPHRCVVLVHGIGRQVRGATLLSFGEPFAWFLRRYLTKGRSVEVDTDLTLLTRGLGPMMEGASSTIRACIEAGDGTAHEGVIRLHEAWWAEHFLPSGQSTVYVWLAHMWFVQVRSVVAGIAHSLGRRQGPSPAELDSPIYQAAPRTPAETVYDVLMAALLLVMLVLGAPLLLLVALLAWALGSLLRLAGPFGSVPASPITDSLREQPECAGATICERHVVNTDDPFGDHQAYWRNDPEVQSVVAYEVLGCPEPPYPGLLRSVAERARRRRAVRLLAFVRLAMLAGIVMLLVAWAGNDERTLDLAFVGLSAALLLAFACVLPRGGRLAGFGLASSLVLLIAIVAMLFHQGVDELATPSHLARENIDDFEGLISGLLTPLLLLWYKIVRTFFFAPSIEFHPWME